MANDLEIAAYRKGRELLVDLRGRLVLQYSQDVKERLGKLFSPQIDLMYIDLSQLSFLDSAGLGVLIGLKMTANQTRTRLAFLSPPSRVREIFNVSKIDSIFDIRRGTDAEILQSVLKKQEFCLWDDNNHAARKDSSADAVGPVTAASGDSIHGTPPPVVICAAANNEAHEDELVKQLCQDAVEYIKQGDYQKAIEIYLRSLEVDSQNLTALNNLGIVYEKNTEWYPLARDVWQKVLDISHEANDDKHAIRARKHLDSLSKLIDG